jgi:hypothetical protein
VSGLTTEIFVLSAVMNTASFAAGLVVLALMP